MPKGSIFVGMDVHKRFIHVAIRREFEELRDFRLEHTKAAVRKLVRRLREMDDGAGVVLCYEAGPTGYGLSRLLNREAGFTCFVVAPSLIPRKPGDRVKTDRRDACKLAEYLESGLLTEVVEPSEEDEARRELWRCRQAAKADEKAAKHRLSKFLLRHERRFKGGKSKWTKLHLRWLEQQSFELRWMQTAFDSLLRAFEQARDRVRVLDEALEAASQDDAVRDTVGALRCFKGIDTTTAMGLVTELHTFERFRAPTQLMSFVGLTPSEYSTGGKAKRGGISKAGNGEVRRLLVEAAWNISRSNKTGRVVRRRRMGQPTWAVDLADKALHRLHRRYWALVNRGKNPNVAITAVARELAGFIWAAMARLTYGPEADA